MQLTDLPWLPTPPRDFRQQVRTLTQTPDACDRAYRLSNSRLSVNEHYTLGTSILKLAQNNADAVLLGVLANGSADLLHSAIAVGALRHGVWLRILGTSFNQVANQALSPNSEINRSGCHYVLLCIDHRGLPFVTCPGDEEQARASLETALRYFDALCTGLKSASGCTLIAQTIPPLPGTLFGSMERSVPGTLAWLIDQYNREIRLRITRSTDLLLDAAALAESVGLAHWHDPTQWVLGKFQFAHDAVPLYADWVGRVIGAARGKSRKCLVLDLDNTLWGGTIGDDGLEGIDLGNDTPAGEAHLCIQQTAIALRDRGIILAISSKNDDDVARTPFRHHPEMILKEAHISAFQANWENKAANLAAIARKLNIGIDTLVLLDDSPFERAQVRDAIPTIAVPELPSDPALFSEFLLAAGYFESVNLTTEDLHRAKQYQENAARAELLGASTDLNAYLRSLEMQAIFGPFDGIGRARITQLINKTNQFNLTTRRYAESQVIGFETSSSAFTLQVKLMDRFGDYGMIAVLICLREGDDWVIDTWLMSCRVLHRGVEQAILNHLASCARTAGIRRLIGQFHKTERNSIVRDHYARLGFTPHQVSDTDSCWHLDVGTFVPIAVPVDTSQVRALESVL